MTLAVVPTNWIHATMETTVKPMVMGLSGTN
jgi:oxalate decarboxylase/phosphoglucose isomerase-like protein (cupin superfamily)